jgi:lysozyme
MNEAFELLKRGIGKYERALTRHIKRPIPQHQFDALCSWCYNVGTGWVRKATVIRKINEGAGPKQLYDALMMYKKPKEIIGRRKKEAKLLAYGQYSNNGQALLFPVSGRGYPIYSRGKTINVWEYINESSEVQPAPEKVERREEKEEQVKPNKAKPITWVNLFKEWLDKFKK